MVTQSTTRPKSILLSCPSPTFLPNLDFVNEFTLVPPKEAKIKYLGLHSNPAAGCVAVRASVRSCAEAYIHGENYFYDQKRAVGCRGGGGRAWGWHISANNHITHRNPHSTFMIPPTTTPPPTSPPPSSIQNRPAFFPKDPTQTVFRC